MELCFSCLFFFNCYGHHRDLHSFPTRRSSDLCESPQQREADLRALQGRQARRRDSHHLQAQSQAQAASGLSTQDRKSTRLNSSHMSISYAVFCLKKKNNTKTISTDNTLTYTNT